MSDLNQAVSGIELVKLFMSDRWNMSARKAIQQCLEHNQLTLAERNHRSNIRNAYLIEDVSVLEAGKEQQDEWGKLCLQEMIDQCEEETVTNFGKTTL
jgi:hypothetical protein